VVTSLTWQLITSLAVSALFAAVAPAMAQNNHLRQGHHAGTLARRDSRGTSVWASRL
jgi:hypothetical protein